MSTGLFDLRGVKPTATHKIRSLASMKFNILPETVRCARCNQRYLMMADSAGIDPACINPFDLDDAVQIIIQSITSEHDAGHGSDELTLVCELHLQRMGR